MEEPRSYFESVIERDPVTRESKKFIRDGVVYVISGQCEFEKCGAKCCKFYLSHGYEGERTADGLPCFDPVSMKCRLHPDNPEWCRRFPANEGFIYIHENCTYVVTREDTGEVVKFGRKDEVTNG